MSSECKVAALLGTARGRLRQGRAPRALGTASGRPRCPAALRRISFLENKVTRTNRQERIRTQGKEPGNGPELGTRGACSFRCHCNVNDTRSRPRES